jgi:4'-phosphopantetheinyl transferase EntD
MGRWKQGPARAPGSEVFFPKKCRPCTLFQRIQMGSVTFSDCPSMTTSQPLRHAIDAIPVPGILVDYRLITDSDELALLPEEMAAFAGSVLKVRRASGAARIVARQLLSRFGQTPCAIPKSTAGMPIWPDGIVGSLAHESTVAIAAMARQRDFLSVGIDIEPAQALDPDLLNIVATAKERERILDDPYRGRVLFSVKEAIYKAVYPLDGTFLDHHDVEVSLSAGTAVVLNGRTVRFRYSVASHIVALAFIPARDAAG